MDSPSDFRERFGQLRILWQTRLGGYAVGLDEFAPISVVLALDDGVDFDVHERETGIRIYSWERTLGRREIVDDRGLDVLIGAVGAGVSAALAQAPRDQWTAVCPYPGETLPKFSARKGIPCSCLDWDTFWWFSDKVNLLEAAVDLGLPRLPGRWGRINKARYSDLTAEFGGRFVAQLAIGVAGTGTAIIDSQEDWLRAGRRFGDADVWMAPNAGGLSYNVNAVAARRGTAVGYPSVQIVGRALLNSNRSGHCGNDFTATADTPRDVVESVREQTARIGDWMASRGYRGLFGLDFVVDDETLQACVVDLNPRWQGSTILQTQAERRQGRVPLAAFELAMRLGVASDDELIQYADSFFEPLEGSQLFPKNLQPGDWKPRGALAAGVYSPDMQFVRPALRLHELATPRECLVTGGVPRQNRPIGPGMTLLRIASLQSAVDPASGRFRAWVDGAVRRLYETLDLVPAG